MVGGVAVRTFPGASSWSFAITTAEPAAWLAAWPALGLLSETPCPEIDKVRETCAVPGYQAWDNFGIAGGTDEGPLAELHRHGKWVPACAPGGPGRPGRS